MGFRPRSFVVRIALGGVFSLFDFRVGLWAGGDRMTLSLKLGTSSVTVRVFLPGDKTGALLRPDFVGDDGASLMAFSKTLGRSRAPGGILFLLGLP